jgi:superfamily II DNA or RNA helicase
MSAANCDLWPHQIDARDGVGYAWRTHDTERPNAVLLVMPTGAGKTRTAVDCVIAAAKRGMRVLWVVHRRELATQAKERMFRDGIERVGVILDGRPSTDPDAPVQIASAQTLASNGSRPAADLIVWDEAHHTVAETFRVIAAAYPKALHLGLTATPERSDGTALGNVFSHLVAPVSIRQLIAAGTLVPCDVIAPPKATTALAMDPLVAYQTHANGERAVVFAESVAAARELAQRFNEAGITAGFIDASQTVTERDDVLSRFKNGALRVVVNVYVLTEGYDDPSLSVCILARGCGSAGMFLQIVGRVLRASKGKTKATLIDLRGAVHRHGLPDEDREYSLEGKPIRTAKSTIKLSHCKECGAVFKVATECPRCGMALVSSKQQQIKAQKLSKIASVASREEKLAAWKRFCLHVREHGWKPGAAAHRFKAVFGHWPDRSFPTYERVCREERAAWINAQNNAQNEQVAV